MVAARGGSRPRVLADRHRRAGGLHPVHAGRERAGRLGRGDARAPSRPRAGATDRSRQRRRHRPFRFRVRAGQPALRRGGAGGSRLRAAVGGARRGREMAGRQRVRRGGAGPRAVPAVAAPRGIRVRSGTASRGRGPRLERCARCRPAAGGGRRRCPGAQRGITAGAADDRPDLGRHALAGPAGGRRHADLRRGAVAGGRLGRRRASTAGDDARNPRAAAPADHADGRAAYPDGRCGPCCLAAAWSAGWPATSSSCCWTTATPRRMPRCSTTCWPRCATTGRAAAGTSCPRRPASAPSASAAGRRTTPSCCALRTPPAPPQRTRAATGCGSRLSNRPPTPWPSTRPRCAGPSGSTPHCAMATSACTARASPACRASSTAVGTSRSCCAWSTRTPARCCRRARWSPRPRSSTWGRASIAMWWTARWPGSSATRRPWPSSTPAPSTCAPRR